MMTAIGKALWECHSHKIAGAEGWTALLGCALSVGVFAYSLWSGSAPVPEKYRADDVSR